MTALYDYVIVGGGLAGASAIKGIRERDIDGSILLVGAEDRLPYHRPPLTKALWFGKRKVEDIFIHDEAFYTDHGVAVHLETRIADLDINSSTVTGQQGEQYRYRKLLLATGATPRRLAIPGGEIDGVYYYRNLEDYETLRLTLTAGTKVLVVGGGFIGSELAAAFSANEADVTMIFPGPHLCSRVFPDYLGVAIQRRFAERGIRILAEDRPSAIEKIGTTLRTYTTQGREVDADIIVVGVGVTPEIALAQQAGLAVGDGIVVDALLNTSHPDVFAAGDNAFFPYVTLGRDMRVEHWDNALNQGKCAGRNMAGARQGYSYEPYFFSTLFELDYEAVGDVDASLTTFADWQKAYDTGVIYYLDDAKVRGVMLCNLSGKMDAAREILRRGTTVASEDLRGAIS